MDGEIGEDDSDFCFLMNLSSEDDLMNLRERRTQDEMLERHHPDIYKQYKAGVSVEVLQKKYPKVFQQYQDGEIGEDDPDYLMNLRERRTQDEMLERHYPDIYKQYMAGVSVEVLQKKYPKVVQQYQDGEIGEDDPDYLMNLSGGLSQSTMAQIEKAYPHIAKEYLAGASVSKLTKKYPDVAQKYGLSLMNLADANNIKFIF